MPSVIGRQLVIGFVLAVALLLVNAVISFRATERLIENNERVAHTKEVIESLLATLSAMKDAETAHHGFLLTGDEQFLEPYHSAANQVGASLAHLKELTTESTFQQNQLPILENAANARLKTLAENLELYKTGGSEAVVRQGSLLAGKQRMDEMRQTVSEIQAVENGILQQRLEESRASGRSALVTLAVANTLAFVFLASAFLLIKRNLQHQKKEEEMLLAEQHRLEFRVNERTAELHDTNAELERSNRELQDFAFVASHDLQEPLRKIQAFGDRLRSKHGASLGSEALDYLTRMQNAAQRMHTLINDLLAYSRVTTKAQPFVRTDLENIAREVLTDLEVRINQTGGNVEISEMPVIEADPMQMRQLLQNLIGNGLKFHRSGIEPIIVVKGRTIKTSGNNASAKGSNSQCRITVEDNGIGFDEKYLDRIFTPFQRLHGRGEYEGTGIGLAVCRKIVERHGGTLTAESKPGHGATFIVTLPVEHGEKGAEK